MAKKVTLADVKKKLERLKKERETIQTRKKELLEKEAEVERQIKETKADYVIQLLDETDTSLALLEDLLVSDDNGGEA